MGNENCWSTEINKILNINGLGHYFTLPCHNKSLINSLSSSLLQHDTNMYYESCLSYSKLRLYINICEANSKATYLYKPLTFTQRRNLARFRLGTLPLRSETSNYLPKPVPIEAKLCLNCSRNEIESMEHLFYCTRHEQLRVGLYSKIGVPPPPGKDYL